MYKTTGSVKARVEVLRESQQAHFWRLFPIGHPQALAPLVASSPGHTVALETDLHRVRFAGQVPLQRQAVFAKNIVAALALKALVKATDGRGRYY